MSTNGPFKKYIIDAVISIRAEIEKDPLSEKEIGEIILEAGIGKNYLRKAFKTVVGCTMQDYRLIKRLEMAKMMLEEGRLSIQQIARKVGYRKSGNFTAFFKKRIGFPPTKFQSQYNEAV